MFCFHLPPPEAAVAPSVTPFVTAATGRLLRRPRIPMRISRSVGYGRRVSPTQRKNSYMYETASCFSNNNNIIMTSYIALISITQ